VKANLGRLGRWIALHAVLIVVLGLTGSAAAQSSRTLVWDRWDVTIDQVDAVANSFRVTETYDMAFSGTFRFGTAAIPMGRIEGISVSRVLQDGRALLSGCQNAPGTFCTGYKDGNYEIGFNFFTPITDGSARFVLEYIVTGAIRVYPDGDQIWWNAIPSEHFGFPIRSGTITMMLPNGYAPREGIDPVEVYGVPGTIEVNGTTIRARADRQIGGSEEFGIRAQFPHHPNARVPRWQATDDAQRTYDETTRPVLNLVLIAVSGVILLGGVLFVLARYFSSGQDPKLGVVPEYLSSPPSSLPPSIVGGLIDESVDLRDIMATLVDLARRGYLVIEEDQTDGVFGKSSTFTFKRTDEPAGDLREHERIMLERIFAGGALERSMESLRNSFYTTIPQLRTSIYQAMVKEGLFRNNPETTRSIWTGAGVVIALLGAAGGFLMLINEGPTIADTLACLPIALVILGLTMVIAAVAMPSKTQKGAEEAAKWRAFEKYLRNLKKLQGEQAAAQHFEEYLPYAIAFGIDRMWMRELAEAPDVFVGMPPWYYPRHRGGRWAGGYTAGTPIPTGPVFPGDVARAGGGFSLDDMSRGMSNGLDSLSSGLSSMLNGAANAMTSRPQSTGSSGRWSSGGRSFSGGGFRGGGGGGGSRGFG
jgi:uncharacterized membrane protein YgcG